MPSVELVVSAGQDGALICCFRTPSDSIHQVSIVRDANGSVK
jgi:hypothetical protein